MSYYAGDYYRGDYYRGDPGFFGFLGSLTSKLAGAVMPGGGVVSAAAGALMRRAPTAMLERGRQVLSRHPVLSGAAAAGTIGALGMGAGRMMAGPGGVPLRGYHMSKPHKCSCKPPHMVKNRRMRVTNPRALRRAIRRATGFAHLAKRVLRFTSPRPPRGRAYFRKTRRAAGRLKA